MKYYHVDVFSSGLFSGNGLAVVFPETPLSPSLMQKITVEFRQFETIFVFPAEGGRNPVRIFTTEEELPFAGHPLVGAAAVIHSIHSPGAGTSAVRLAVGERTVELNSSSADGKYSVVMNQGCAEFSGRFSIPEISGIAGMLGLSPDDLHPAYPAEVVSTGLPYLLIPVRSGLERAGIRAEGFEKELVRLGAKFVYVFEPGDSPECRTWDNSGSVEDVATGSAAGPLCAYLVKNGFRKPGERITIRQGRFAGRPSEIEGWVASSCGEVFIEGGVSFFAEGTVNAL